MGNLYGDSIFNEGFFDKFKKPNNSNDTTKYTVSNEIKGYGNQAAEILREYVKKLYSSPEWKKIQSYLNKNSRYKNDDGYIGWTKMPTITFTFNKNKMTYYIETDPYWLSQEDFLEEYKKGKIVADYLDQIYNKIKSDSRIKKIPKFSNTYTDDDYANWGITLKVEESDLVKEE